MMFINTNEDSSDSGAAAAAAGSSSVYAATQGTLAQIKDLTDAFDNFIVSTTKLDTIVDNINKSMTSMNDSAVSLQRSMGGVVFGANDFRERMYQTYMNTIKLGSTFKDVTESIEGLATGMGRIVNPSMETLENMIEISKASGISTKEIGMMVAEMVRFGGTQLDATNKIQSLSI
jgi:methyl-accepting chemotaxis protein